jgi:hypothetical protein
LVAAETLPEIREVARLAAEARYELAVARALISLGDAGLGLIEWIDWV